MRRPGTPACSALSAFGRARLPRIGQLHLKVLFFWPRAQAQDRFPPPTAREILPKPLPSDLKSGTSLSPPKMVLPHEIVCPSSLPGGPYLSKPTWTRSGPFKAWLASSSWSQNAVLTSYYFFLCRFFAEGGFSLLHQVSPLPLHGVPRSSAAQFPWNFLFPQAGVPPRPTSLLLSSSLRFCFPCASLAFFVASAPSLSRATGL